MRNFQQKRGLREVIHSRPILVVLGLVVLFFAWGVIGFMGKTQITRENRKIAENKLAELEEKRDKLSLEIAKLRTESGIEENIREKFGLAKEVEGLIVVVEDQSKKEVEENQSGGFFSFFKNLFK